MGRVTVGEGYSTFSTRGGGDAVTLARTALRHVEDRLAERRAGEAGVGTVEELSAIRAEVATFESGRGGARRWRSAHPRRPTDRDRLAG
ncbi:MAG TPA: hypothetical protein VGB03_08850 [Acidimicrobiales bacterium]